jgi:hypothetical protein
MIIFLAPFEDIFVDASLECDDPAKRTSSLLGDLEMLIPD